jgi:hypothetical protein
MGDVGSIAVIEESRQLQVVEVRAQFSITRDVPAPLKSEKQQPTAISHTSSTTLHIGLYQKFTDHHHGKQPGAISCPFPLTLTA